MKSINCFDASFVHSLVAPKQFVYKAEAVINANAFSEIPNGRVFQRMSNFSFLLLKAII